MKKAIILLGMLVFAISGCMSNHNSVPNNLTEVKMVAEIKTNYKILGPTEGKGEAVKVLFWWVDQPKKSADNCTASVSRPSSGFFGMIQGMIFGPKNRAEKQAAYNALENFPGADRLIDAKWKTEVQDYVIYKKAVSTCKGTAVQFSHK